MLAELQRMVIDFLNAIQAAHRSYLPEGVFETPWCGLRNAVRGAWQGWTRKNQTAHAGDEQSGTGLGGS